MIDSRGCLQALFPISDTFYLVINTTPTLLPYKRGPPHQLPVTHHHSPASACHVLGVKGVPLLSLIRKEPHHLLHRALNHNQWLGRQRWIGTLTTLYLPGTRLPPPGPPKSCRHWQIIAVIFGRMCRSSLLPLKGSYHKSVDGHSFLFRNNGHNVQQHVWQTPQKAPLTAKKMIMSNRSEGGLVGSRGNVQVAGGWGELGHCAVYWGNWLEKKHKITMFRKSLTGNIQTNAHFFIIWPVLTLVLS